VRRPGNGIFSPFESLWDVLVTGGINSSRNEAESNDDHDTLECVQDDEFIRKRREMVTEWLQQPKNRRTAEWKEDFYKKWGLAKSQIYRILKQYRSFGDKGLQLQYFNSGRNPKLVGKVLEFLETARRHFLNTGVTLKIAYSGLEEMCNGAMLETPKFSTFKWYIYQNTSAIEKGQKVGQSFAKSRFTPSMSSFQGGMMPLQVIQMDNTMLDVFPVDEAVRKVLPTPYMTAAIDCYTGMITGFTVSYFASSAQTILDVLVQSILPKEEYTREYETEYEWPIRGYPVVLLVDNGMDYSSTSVRDFCIKYDIILEFAPIKTPRYKAYIEQWFNVLKNAIKQDTVPGFRPSLKQRLENPELNPENDASMTLREIEIWLYKWIIDEHQFASSYDDHVQAPFLKFQDVKKAKTRLIYPDPREPPEVKWEIDALYLSQLVEKEPTLSKDGITWEYLRYNNKELMKIHQKSGNEKIEIRRNKRDVRYIWVKQPSTDLYIKVGLGSGWASTLLKIFGDSPVNESTWIKKVRSVQVEIKGKLTTYLLKTHLSKLQRKDLINSSIKLTKLARKEQEKVRETQRKDFNSKIEKTEKVEEEETVEDDQDKDVKKEIDWSKIELLPTDDFYKGR